MKRTSSFIVVLLAMLSSTIVPALADEIDDWQPTYTIDFMAAFDKTGAEWAIKRSGTLEAFGEAVVKQMNRVMYNSKLDAKFRLAGTYSTTDVVKEVVHGPTYCQNSLEIRQAAKECEADMTLLMITAEGSLRSESGNAAFMPRSGDAYGCVIASNAIDGLTAIHECGHMMGCAHARDVDVNNPHPYNAGAMRWIDGVQYSTVMGYHGILLPYFSSPSFIYKGTAMGSSTEDCCRMITERLPEIVRLGDVLECYELGCTEWFPNYAAQQLEVSLRSYNKKAYKIKSDADWLTPSINQGYLEEPFTIEVKNNGTDQVREGHIVVSDWDADNPEYDRDDILGPATITVRQLPQRGLLAMPEKWNAPYYGGTTQMKIYTDVSFMIENDSPEWLSVSQEYGSGNSAITLTAQENTASSPRTAHLTIHYYGRTLDYVVSQDAFTDVPTCIGCLGREGQRTADNGHEIGKDLLIYDLQGRSYVRQPKSGLFIQDGRKVVR